MSVVVSAEVVVVVTVVGMIVINGMAVLEVVMAIVVVVVAVEVTIVVVGPAITATTAGFGSRERRSEQYQCDQSDVHESLHFPLWRQRLPCRVRPQLPVLQWVDRHDLPVSLYGWLDTINLCWAGLSVERSSCESSKRLRDPYS